jgi:hypothetical protein
MVIYERAKKVLAVADYYLHGPSGQPDRFHFWFCRRAVYLYTVLTAKLLAVSSEL